MFVILYQCIRIFILWRSIFSTSLTATGYYWRFVSFKIARDLFPVIWWINLNHGQISLLICCSFFFFSRSIRCILKTLIVAFLSDVLAILYYRDGSCEQFSRAISAQECYDDRWRWSWRTTSSSFADRQCKVDRTLAFYLYSTHESSTLELCAEK